MNRRPNTYALLAAVGKYDSMTQLDDLGCAQNDLNLMEQALVRGLKMEPDNIRKLGGDGVVTSMSFARSIAEFDSLLQDDDTFFFYFSGHGRNRELVFTDGGITIQSIVDHIERIPARQKIVILDCCYSGQARAGQLPQISYEDSIAAFAGKGIAVFASCAAESESRLSEGGAYSPYTQVICHAMMSRRLIREGKMSLTDISSEVRYLVEQWNRVHPDRAQNPIYRESMVGTIFFPVEEYHPYTPQKVFLESEAYIVHHVKPMSTGTQKRLAAFVILKKDDDSIVPEVTRQIIPQILYADVYASRQSEQQFHGRAADVVWCYFGHDETNLIRSNHFAYTIWSGDEKLRDTYYRRNRNAEVVGDIYVFWNTSYQTVKELQENACSEDEIVTEYRRLSNMLVAHAEPFIKDLEEVENGTLAFQTVKIANQKWIQEVKQLYFKLSEAEVAPDSVYDWAEAVLDMAGWVVDMAIGLEHAGETEKKADRWLIDQSVRRYQKAVERLRIAEAQQAE